MKFISDSLGIGCNIQYRRQLALLCLCLLFSSCVEGIQVGILWQLIKASASRQSHMWPHNSKMGCFWYTFFFFLLKGICTCALASGMDMALIWHLFWSWMMWFPLVLQLILAFFAHVAMWKTCQMHIKMGVSEGKTKLLTGQLDLYMLQISIQPHILISSSATAMYLRAHLPHHIFAFSTSNRMQNVKN